MRTITVRLPESVAADIEAESRERQLSMSDVVRERLAARRKTVPRRAASFDAIADLIGSVDGLPAKLSARKKSYLRRTGYGGKRHR
jgi:Arc/MetJ-type ribon-helix-helix transcriptional regulator